MTRKTTGKAAQAEVKARKIKRDGIKTRKTGENNKRAEARRTVKEAETREAAKRRRILPLGLLPNTANPRAA